MNQLGATLAMLTHALLLVPVWILLGLMHIGLGLLIARTQQVRRIDGHRLFIAFWFGLAFAIAFLQIWQLLWPVSWIALAVLLVLGGVGLTLDSTRLLRWIITAGRLQPGLLIGLLLLAVWLGNRALGPPVGDSGLYHLSAIRWMREYAIVPGLANLHHRLGFNNASLLWAALLEIGPLPYRANHVSNSLLVLVTMVYAVSSTVRGVRGWTVAAGLLAPLVMHAITLHELRISSLDPDTVVGLITFAGLLRLHSACGDGELPQLRRYDLGFALVMFALAVVVKLSAIGLALGGAVAVAWTARWVPPDRNAPSRNWVLMLLCASLLAPWLLRSVVLSGYPLFPSALAGVPVDWIVPASVLDLAAYGIRSHYMPPVAQEFGQRSGGCALCGWIVWQATRCPELVLVPSLIAVSGLAILGRRLRWRRVAPVVFPCFVAILPWALTAPAPRFGYAYFWFPAAAALSEIHESCTSSWPTRRLRRVSLAIVVFLALTPMMHRVAAWAWQHDYRNMIATLMLPPHPGTGYYPAPSVELAMRVTKSGLTVFTPTGDDKVWDAPLPATPEFRVNLSLRTPGSLASGFRLE